MIIFDIRTQQEYNKGHICSAFLVKTPLPPLTSEKTKNLYEKLKKLTVRTPKDMRIYVYCKKGIRAKKAKDILNKLGFHNVVSLGGVEQQYLKKLIANKKVKFCKK